MVSLFTQTVWVSDSWITWSVWYCVTVNDRPDLATSECKSEMLLGLKR